MSANAKMKKLYGITTQEIYGDAAQGDEIPDADAEMETLLTFLQLCEFCFMSQINKMNNLK